MLRYKVPCSLSCFLLFHCCCLIFFVCLRYLSGLFC
jgi:hypothetical protein